MGTLFSKKKSINNQITENDKAILKLKHQRDKIKQYQKRLTLQLEKEEDVVRKLVKDNKKERALLMLKKKKYTESLINKTDNHLANIEEMVQTIEFEEIQLSVVEKLKIGNEVLTKLNDALDIDQIEDILCETKEAVEKQKEISKLLDGNKISSVQEDDESLLKELNELIKEDNEDDIKQMLPDIDNLEPVKMDQEKLKKDVANKKILVEAS